MERSNIQKLGDVLNNFLKENKLDKNLRERRLIESWEELMGKTIQRATSKIYIRDKKLFVHLSSSVIRNELHMLKQEILKKLNEKVGEEVITEIVLK